MIDKARQAARVYLERLGYKHLGIADPFDVYLDDDDCLVFVKTICSIKSKGFAEPEQTVMEDFEQTAFEWLSKHPDDYANIPVRCDVVSLNIINDSRAFMKHYINILN